MSESGRKEFESILDRNAERLAAMSPEEREASDRRCREAIERLRRPG